MLSFILFGAGRLADGGEAGVPSLLGFAVLCLQLAYMIPIWIKIKLYGRHRLLDDAPWHIGSYGFIVDRAAFFWLLLSGAVSVFALGLWGAVGTGIWLIFVMAMDRRYRKQHLASLQSRLKRPKGEIIRIERKFHLH